MFLISAAIGNGVPNLTNSLHLVCNHGGIPDINRLVKFPRHFTLADLKDELRFPRTVTIQGRGTRQIEQIAEYPGEGDELIAAPWGGVFNWSSSLDCCLLKRSFTHVMVLRKEPSTLDLWRRDSFQIRTCV